MQLITVNAIMTILVTVFLIPVQLLVFYFVLGKNYKSVEYKVAIGYILSVNVLVMLVTLNLDIMELGFQFGLIISPIMILLPYVALYYIVRYVRNNRLALKKTINKSKDASINIANMATELAASASEVNASAEEISSTTQEVSVGALTQVKKLSDINQTANNINQLAESVKNSSDNINKVMGLITNIAEQTNLLALNASIEAGRAGEHGRGFAVVADEVRKLAEESKSAVGSSNEQIMDIISKIEKTVDFVRKITMDLQEALSLSEEASAAMEEINASAEEQTASMEEIAATSNRLGELSEDLKKSLTEKKYSKKASQKKYVKL